MAISQTQSSKAEGLRFGPVGTGAVHICVDLQMMFDAGTPWATGWLQKILPNVIRVAERHPDRTIFTRFIPPRRVQDARGAWGRYYQQYPKMTLERINPDLVELVSELRPFVPPALIFDKRSYSPWGDPRFLILLQQRRVDTVIVSGGETDICVMATVLGAVDAGFRVIVATDALCRLAS